MRLATQASGGLREGLLLASRYSVIHIYIYVCLSLYIQIARKGCVYIYIYVHTFIRFYTAHSMLVASEQHNSPFQALQKGQENYCRN